MEKERNQTKLAGGQIDGACQTKRLPSCLQLWRQKQIQNKLQKKTWRVEAAFSTGSWVRLRAANREKGCGTKTNQKKNRLGMTNGRCNKKKEREENDRFHVQKPNHICSFTEKIKKNKNKHRNFSFPDSLSFFFLQTGMIAGKTQFSY